MSIATLHHYNVSTTVELSDESTSRLGAVLEELSREQAPEQRAHAGVVWGKTGEQPVHDFNPVTLRAMGVAE